MRLKFYDDSESDFGDEPTDNNIVQVLSSGIGDGTIRLDDDDDVDYSENDEESAFNEDDIDVCKRLIP